MKQLLFDMRSLHSEMLATMKGHLAKFNLKASADINEIASCLRCEIVQWAGGTVQQL